MMKAFAVLIAVLGADAQGAADVARPGRTGSVSRDDGTQ
jgi:hypothetical protein